MSFKISLIYFFVSLLVISSFAQSGLRIFPGSPKPGDKINGSFSQRSVMNVYHVGKNGNIISTTSSIDENGKFNLYASDSTAAFLIVAQDMTDKNAKPKAYPIMVISNNKPYKGTYLSLYRFVTSKKEDLSLPATDSIAVEFLKSEFAAYPDSKRSNLAAFLYSLSSFKKWSAKPKVLDELQSLSKQKDLTKDELAMLSYLYELYGEKDKAEKYARLLLNREAKGTFALSRTKVDAFNQENYDKKLVFYKELQIGSLPPYQLYHNLVNENLLKENFAGVHELIADRPKEVRSRTYYMVACSMIQKKQDIEQAHKYAEWGYELAKNDYDHPKDEFDKMYAKFNRGRSAETMGYVLASEGKFKEAVVYFDEGKLYAPQTTAVELVDLYLLTIANSEKYAEVKNKIEQKIKGGEDSPALKEALLGIYKQEKKTEEGFLTYLNQLQAISNESIVAEVKKKMLSQAAPDFTLNDINGNKITLSSLKGKVVVVDFWATWCGPCIASFPGMQKAIEKYKNDPDVVFLFINTWERIPDPIVKVTDFVRTKKLPFTVLMDVGDKVVAAYGVKGIPNKFIIDRKGNIRFSSEGSPPGIDALVTEVSTMIDLAK